MILFLDDSALRQQAFEEHSKTVVLCAHRGNVELQMHRKPLFFNSAEAIITFMKENSEKDFAEIYLDHDLLGEHFQDSGSRRSGMEVVRYLEDVHRNVGLIVVHTMNHKAGVEMTKRLGKTGYHVARIPFENLIRSMRQER